MRKRSTSANLKNAVSSIMRSKSKDIDSAQPENPAQRNSIEHSSLSSSPDTVFRTPPGSPAFRKKKLQLQQSDEEVPSGHSLDDIVALQEKLLNALVTIKDLKKEHSITVDNLNRKLSAAEEREQQTIQDLKNLLKQSLDEQLESNEILTLMYKIIHPKNDLYSIMSINYDIFSPELEDHLLQLNLSQPSAKDIVIEELQDRLSYSEMENQKLRDKHKSLENEIKELKSKLSDFSSMSKYRSTWGHSSRPPIFDRMYAQSSENLLFEVKEKERFMRYYNELSAELEDMKRRMKLSEERNVTLRKQISMLEKEIVDQEKHFQDVLQIEKKCRYKLENQLQDLESMLHNSTRIETYVCDNKL